MTPELFGGDEVYFKNPLAMLTDCISCIVTEERNGIFECQFTYPINGSMFSEIEIGRIIYVKTSENRNLGVQPFDIYAKKAMLNGTVTFYAHHISYRLGNIILRPMEAQSCAEALSALPANTYNDCPFTFNTNKTTTGTWTNKIPCAVKSILNGQEGSILDVYGTGEYEWDKWSVNLYTNRGYDNNISIRYGVNLTDLTQNNDASSSYNAVAPYWASNVDGTVVTLDDGIIVSDAIGNRKVPLTAVTDDYIFNQTVIEDGRSDIIELQIPEQIVPVPLDMSEEFDTAPTQAQLRDKAFQKLQRSQAWLPSENIKIKFVNLADTIEYKFYNDISRVSLCDTITVYCGPLGINAIKMKVVRTAYNVLLERYEEIELN